MYSLVESKFRLPNLKNFNCQFQNLNYFIRQLQLLRKMALSILKVTSPVRKSATANSEILIDRHPLLNSVVLSIVFNYVPKSSWKSIRLVNKTWYLELLSRWRNQMFVYVDYKFDHGTQPPTCTDVTNVFVSNHPDNNPEDPYQLRRHPFRNMDTCLMTSSHHAFWQFCGSWLKHLRLNQIRISSFQLLRQVLFELTPNLEELQYISCKLIEPGAVAEKQEETYKQPSKLQLNLKSLYIQMNFDSEDFQPFPISWMSLLSVYQNTQKIYLRYIPHIKTDLEVSSLLKTIDTIRKANGNSVLNITDLDFASDVQDGRKNLSMETITKLCDLSLPLSKLTIDVQKSGKDGLIKLLTSYQESLQELTFLSEWVSLDVTRLMTFPNNLFPHKLTKLVAHGSLLSTLKFLPYTPNLKILHVRRYYECDDVVNDLKEMKLNPITSITELHYDSFNSTSEELAKMLVGIMPNVKNVGMACCAKAFGVICEHWNMIQRAVFVVYQINEQVFVNHLKKLKGLRSVTLKVPRMSDKTIDTLLALPFLTSVKGEFSRMTSKRSLEAIRSKLEDTRNLTVQKPLQDDYEWSAAPFSSDSDSDSTVSDGDFDFSGNDANLSFSDSDFVISDSDSDDDLLIPENLD